jgi:hypothetical protein
MVVEVDEAYEKANEELESNPKNAASRRLSKDIKNLDVAKL